MTIGLVNIEGMNETATQVRQYLAGLGVKALVKMGTGPQAARMIVRVPHRFQAYSDAAAYCAEIENIVAQLTGRAAWHAAMGRIVQTREPAVMCVQLPRD
jgi:hypothetical protein